MMNSDEHVFFGWLLVKTEKIHDDKQPTLYTTIKKGKIELHYNVPFLLQYGRKEQCALIEHELLHLACGHFERFRDHNQQEAQSINVSCDCAINQLIKNLPTGGVTYDELNKFLRKNGMLHDMERFREAEYYYKLCKQYIPTDSGFGCGTFKIDRSQITDMDHQEVLETLKEVIRVSRNVPSLVEKFVDEKSKPDKLNWKQLLALKCQKAVKQGMRNSWKRLKKRFPEGCEELKGKIPDYKPKVVVAVDTSGSIFSDKDTLAEFQGQILKIQETYKAEFTVVECDEQIQKTYKLRPHTKLSGKYNGGGGTDFRPVFELCEKQLKPAILVFLTDGYGHFPPKASKFTTIWCTVADNKSDFPFGEVICIEAKKNV